MAADDNADDNADDDAPGRLGRIKTTVTVRVANYRDTHPWFAHVGSAWGLLQRNNGNQYAAAITYFSFLALFPLLLLAVSITGFILHSHPGLEQDFFNKVTTKVPGEFGTTLKTALRTAIDKRAGVGIVGVVGVALAGGAWIGNLRQAIDGVWGREKPDRNFVVARLLNMGVLFGLGVGLLLSLGLTAVGTSLTTQILSFVGFNDLPGAHAVLKVLGIGIAAAGDSLIFWWVLVKLPAVEVPRRISIKGALLAAVGFEILKIVGTYTIAKSASSPTAGPFAGILAVLIWIQLVARYLLFSCAWTATLTAEHNAAQAADVPVDTADESAVETGETRDAREMLPDDAPSPTMVGATLIGAGAVAGAVATWAFTRPRPDTDHD